MTATDYINRLNGADGGLGSITVSPSDTVDLKDSNGLPKVARRLFIQVGGTVKFRGVDGQDDTWTVPNNFWLEIAVTRVWSTGTSATGIHAIW